MSVETMSDPEFVERFAELAILPGEFHHREHIRLAFALLAKHRDFADAAVEFRRMLRAFAAHHGVPERYHETITWAYLAVVHERMAVADHASSHVFVAANPDLLDHKTALARYYDVGEITRSSLARRVFVLPIARHDGA
jgi:hypothetical protein